MELKDIIKKFEEILDKRLNEETLAPLVNPLIMAALTEAKAEFVLTAEQIASRQADVKRPTFSQWMGDLKRIASGQAPINCKPEEKDTFYTNAITNVNPAILRALSETHPHLKSLYTSSDAAGGYLVPTEESNRLIDLTRNFEVIPALCQQIPMRTNSIVFPTLTSGLTAYWIPEATSSSAATQATGQKQESNPTFASMTVTTHVLAIYVFVSNKLLDESDPAIDQVLFNLFGRTLGSYFDIACLRGAGTATDPVTGLANLITTNLLTAGAVANFSDIIDLIYSVYDASDAGTQTVPVIGNTKSERTLLKVQDNDGQYIFKGPRDGTKGIPSLWTEPWYRDNNILNTLGAGSSTRLFAGDFANHGYVGNSSQMSIRVNPWGTGFPINQTAFLAEFRRGFQVSSEDRFAKSEGWPTT